MLNLLPRARLLSASLLAGVLLTVTLGMRGTHEAAAAAVTAAGSPAASLNGNEKRVCVYDANSISGIKTFAAVVGRQNVDCAMVYDDNSQNWGAWANPWFLHPSTSDQDWAGWVRSSPAGHRRQLIISQSLIPTGLAGTDWLDAGAAGAYTTYAKQLAQNLVNAGVGDAIIRLAWEMNGTWNIDSLGNTTADYAKWVAFWRQTVLAMRSVPGAHFLFDWCPNNGVRPIPLADYYPGDDVVDIIGDDMYDAGVPPGPDRWSALYNRGQGLSSILSFAKAHSKPLSLPEWGVGPANDATQSAGDDPAYVNGIASIVRDNNVAFQTYFYAHQWSTQLQTGPQSLAAYRAAFGDGGYATQSPAQATSGSPRSPSAPASTLASGAAHAVPAAVSPAAARHRTAAKAGAKRTRRAGRRRRRAAAHKRPNARQRSARQVHGHRDRRRVRTTSRTAMPSGSSAYDMVRRI